MAYGKSNLLLFDDLPDPSWLNRVIKSVNKEIKTWPESFRDKMLTKSEEVISGRTSS